MLLALSACTTTVVQPGGRPNPEAAKGGVVYLFAGLTPAGDTMAHSGMYTLTQRIRDAGVRADVYNPSQWRAAADNFMSQPDHRSIPVSVGGYSMGGGAATRFAERLRAAGVAVQTLLVFEAYDPTPVPCNVRRAIDMYGSAGAFSLSRRLQAGSRFTGSIERVDWSRRHPQGGRYDHWGVSKEPAALDFVANALVSGGSVRKGGGPGCSG
ncbi:MAG: hypothetical protein KF914_09980 [Rhizobiaceae bacterium]|nr:hypothetical protein [Rhizobiaceae bacterium]